jgi:hypothetical protein
VVIEMIGGKIPLVHAPCATGWATLLSFAHT